MQLAAMQGRITNLEDVMSNRVLPAVDILEARIQTVERMVVALGATLARVSREREEERARPY